MLLVATLVATTYSPSSHTSGGSFTEESLAAPDLGSQHAHEDLDGGNLNYCMMYTTPANLSLGPGGTGGFDAVSLAVGNYHHAAYVHRLSGELLAKVQGGGSAHMQIRASSRHGVGISEEAQDNRAAWCARLYRPGSGFIADLWDVGTNPGTNKFPAQATAVNRTWTATMLAAADAEEGDYLCIEVGAVHLGPTSGGTGFGFFVNDATAAADLPEDETTSSNLRCWVDICG